MNRRLPERPAALVRRGRTLAPIGTAMKYLVPKLVRSLTRDLFRDDLEAHWRSFQTFRGHDFDEFPDTLGMDSFR
jgi:hypothetical protein